MRPSPSLSGLGLGREDQVQQFRLQRLLVLAQAVNRRGERDGEARGHARIDEAGALHFLDARQVMDGVQAEMHQEGGVVP